MAAASSSALRGTGYPERGETRDSKLERLVIAARYFAGGASTRKNTLAATGNEWRLSVVIL